VIPQAPKGTDDILPPASEGWRRLLRGFEDLAGRYGFGLTMTPLFEATELFSRGVGETTEVVEKQMYTFPDKSGRSLTLRPEATASVVRAYLGAGMQGVFKGYYAGPMFRYEQPQSGRRRQFYQVGVEYLAEPSPDADVEVIEVGYRLLEQVGVGDVTVRLNSIGDPADRATYREALVAFLEERIESLSDEHFAGVKEGLDRRGIPYEISPRLVRGLDYYNRTVFEYVSSSYTAAQDALGGGGRYDPLSEMLGGPRVTAVGLSMGVDRIVLAMPDVDVAGPDVFVVVADPARRADALGLVARLRDAGLWAEMDLGNRSMKAQFKVAGRRRSSLVAVVGEEWADGEVTMRRMSDGEEQRVDIEEVASWVTSR